jgi:hypothetical protein
MNICTGFDRAGMTNYVSLHHVTRPKTMTFSSTDLMPLENPRSGSGADILVGEKLAKGVFTLVMPTIDYTFLKTAHLDG